MIYSCKSIKEVFKLITIEHENPYTLLELLLKLLADYEEMKGLIEDFDGEIDRRVLEEFRKLLEDGTIEEMIGEEVVANLLSEILEVNEKVEDIKDTIGNVKDYGAVGDGITDDTGAIYNAIKNHSRIYLPKGRYLIQKLYVSTSCVIEGDTCPYAWREQPNTGSVLVVKHDETDPDIGGIINIGWNDGGNSLVFKNITFEGEQGTGTGVWARWDCTFDQCLFRNLTAGIRDYHASRIHDCQFENCTYGIYGLTDIMVSTCTFSRCGTGIYGYSNNGNYNLINNCRIEYCSAYGINLQSCVYNSIIGCQFDKNDLGLQLENATEVCVVGCHFDRNVRYHSEFKGTSGANFTGCQFIKRSTSDGSGGEVKPEKGINLISYSNSVVVGCSANGKLFSVDNYQYKGGELLVDGTITPYFEDYETSGTPEDL